MNDLGSIFTKMTYELRKYSKRDAKWQVDGKTPRHNSL